jgi:hypothetical protein
MWRAPSHASQQLLSTSGKAQWLMMLRLLAQQMQNGANDPLQMQAHMLLYFNIMSPG